MRTYVAPLFFAGCALVAVPVDAAKPLKDGPAVEAASPVAVQQMRLRMPGLREEAAMVLVGTALIGLGAAVRRAV